jgi:hypothetical protein
LAGARDESGQEAGRRVVAAHVDRLAWHAVRYGGGLAFPGDMLFRLSMDLGTGTAGVLLGTAAALAPCGPALPFFAQPARLPVRVLGSPPGEPTGSRRPASTRKEVKAIWHSSISRRWTQPVTVTTPAAPEAN